MSMKKKKKSRQETLWIPHDAVASSPGHPFYEELERVLREEEFDSFVESKCSPYYAKKQGRPSIPPGVYFRMLLIGYFERIDSERGICWRCSDSLSLRQLAWPWNGRANAGPFVAVSDTESTSAGSSRICIWMGARSSSVERDDRWQDTGCGRDDAGSECGASVNRSSRHGGKLRIVFEGACAQEWFEEPSRADIAKLRPKKGSNKEWVNPNEPDAEIMKMKSGGTDMAHKAEHAVDMSGEGAVIAVRFTEARRVTQRAYRIRWKKRSQI